MILNKTTDNLTIELSSAITTNQLDCYSIVKINGVNEPKEFNTNGTNAIDVLTPPVMNNRPTELVYLNVFNRDTVTHTVSFKLNSTLIKKIELATNESFEYSGLNFTGYDSKGLIKSNTGASGGGGGGSTVVSTDKQIVYNDATNLVGSNDFQFDPSTKSLRLLGLNTGIDLQGITTEPTTPSSGILRLYAKSISGKYMIKQVGQSGLDTPLQNAIWQNNMVLFTPQVSAGVWQGTAGANLGTAGIGLPTLTNVGTMLRRSTFASVVTTLNQQVGTRTEAMFYRSNLAVLGGFFMTSRFTLGTWTAGNRLFVGFGVGTTAMVTVNPSTLLNTIGFGVDAGETAITFMHNDATGAATKETIAGQPALATSNAYVCYIYCKPNDNTVYFRLDNLNNNTILIDSSVNTDLPINTTALICHACMSNGANTVAGNATIGINKIYIETDY